MSGGDPASPCINVCVMDPATGYCRGCWRTLDEITQWPTATATDKWHVLRATAERRLAAARRSGSD